MQLRVAMRILCENSCAQDGPARERKDLDGQTALHLAVCNDHKSIVSLLLDKGADTEADQNSGENPLDLAAVSGYVGVRGETLSYSRLSMIFP
jgi:ankyrin repeat protein